MAFSPKSRAEIEALKADWLSDGIWDIEESEGFEAHRAELLAFRKRIEALRAQQDQQAQLAAGLKRANLIADLNDSLGLNNLVLAERLLAFQDRADQHARLLGLLHSFACEASSSLHGELLKNDAWQGIYAELKTYYAEARYL